MTKSTMSLTVLAAVLVFMLGIASDAGPAYAGYQGPDTGLLAGLDSTKTLSAAHLNSDEKEGESCNHD
jgi:hypothetical protein